MALARLLRGVAVRGEAAVARTLTLRLVRRLQGLSCDPTTDTVRSHVRRLLAKLGARDRGEAVQIGQQLRRGARQPGTVLGIEDLDEIASGPWTTVRPGTQTPV